jgi:uncharacterized protein YqiB (DUF1249 family)
MIRPADDTLTPASWRARPRSFVALMGLYESTFIRLSWLAGELVSLEGEHRSSVAGDCDLLLAVKDRSPYTSTLLLTYLLPTAEAPRPCPDMRVRIYHDAHLAEALEWAATPVQSAVRARPGMHQRELDQRWARNVMLNKWLEYCVDRGHRFSAATRI